MKIQRAMSIALLGALCVPVMIAVARPNPMATAGCNELVAAELKGNLIKLTDDEVARGLCATSKAVVDAIASKDSAGEQACLAASVSLAREFKRRWPSRSLQEARGRC